MAAMIAPHALPRTLALLGAMATASCAWKTAPWTATARLAGTGQNVGVQCEQDIKNHHLVIRMPDGRSYFTWCPFASLRRFETEGPPRQQPTDHDIYSVRIEDGRPVTRVTMNTIRAPRMICEFRHLGPADARSENGIGRCETAIGEVIDVRW